MFMVVTTCKENNKKRLKQTGCSFGLYIGLYIRQVFKYTPDINIDVNCITVCVVRPSGSWLQHTDEKTDRHTQKTD